MAHQWLVEKGVWQLIAIFGKVKILGFTEKVISR